MITQKISIGIIVFGICLFIIAALSYDSKKVVLIPEPVETPKPQPKTILTLYVQDKEIARTQDCGVTTKITREIPYTKNLQDASLKILFKEELADYGVYSSVEILDTVAKVRLASDMTPENKPIGSLSSCQSQHLLSVLQDTLSQYPPIESVELYSPEGRIEF